jgi:gliding motility-associated-like protein
LRFTFTGNNVVVVPNAFTPNGDGRNDIIRTLIICNFTLTEFAVYNRYGQQVFLSHDSNKAWDGTFNGRDLEIGAYYYLAKGKNSEGVETLYKGDISLIR